MTFLQEKQSRRHFIFTMFVIGILFCSGFFLSWYHNLQMKQLLLDQELTIASSLLKQNVSADIIAVSFKNTEATKDGAEFLSMTGRTSELSSWMFASLRRPLPLFLLFSLLAAVIAGILLISGTLYFQKKRDCLYQKADEIISEYAEGNFQHHLPSGENGILYQLFSSVEQLATALQAKSALEHKTKEFLKDTVSDISHQLKTPVAALKLYLDIILQEPDNPETVQVFSEKSQNSLNRMEELILTLLKMMRLDAGSILFDKKHCTVQTLASHAAMDLRTRACRENKTLIFKGESDVSLYCDPSWTEEALSNLIKNALDHTKAGDTITVGWKSSPGLLRISVSDTGNGIDPEDLPHIFKRFYRSRHSSPGPGFGLGLPLAKSIIEDQGGMLFAESVYGSGAVFTISFLTDL